MVSNASDCPICHRISHFTVFCIDHEHFWVISEEREAVDWLSDESYDTQLAAFVRRLQNTTVHETDEEDDLQDSKTS